MHADRAYGILCVYTLYMLVAPLDYDRHRMVVFPTWPDYSRDVSFKLRAPLNTVVEAGKLQYLRVTPPSRAKDIVVGPGYQSP